MNISDPIDSAHLDKVLGGVEAARHKMPEEALRALAQEVLVHVARQKEAEPAKPAPAPEIDALCTALLSADRQAAQDFVLHAQARGVGIEALWLSYLTPAAAHLGELWDKDRVSFLEVSVAVGRIYGLMRGLRRGQPLPVLTERRMATFVSVPGDDHTLGVAMAAEMLRSKGWDIHLLVGLGHNRLVDALTVQEPYLMGISVSGSRSIAALTRLLVALRLSLPQTRILVCGHIDDAEADLIMASGADHVAMGFEAAAAELERMAR